MASPMSPRGMVDYNTHAEAVPDCPNCCNNRNVHLADVTLEEGALGGTLPSWHCTSCQRTFSGRTYDGEQHLTNEGVNYGANIVSYVDSGSIQELKGTRIDLGMCMDENSNSLDHAIRQRVREELQIDNIQLRSNPVILEMLQQINDNYESVMKDLRELLKRQEDPTYWLKERVSKFKLTE